MKKYISIILIFSFILCLLSGCGKDTDYSLCPFAGARWTRTTESDTEYIYFGTDGTFSYYCACGNPVNDSDLCEGYFYDSEKKVITLDYIEKSSGSAKIITVKEYSDDSLTLDFDGDIRVFEIDKNNDAAADLLTYKGQSYALIEFPSDIFYYDLTECVDCEEDTVCPIPNDKWSIVYYNGDLFALETDIEAATAYYCDDKNYRWHASIEDIEKGPEYELDLTLTEEEIQYIYTMEDLPRDETIFFEDIEKFAVFAKTSDDGLITARIELSLRNGQWYWRSEIIDESTEGWPEFIFPLPKSLNDQLFPKKF